MPDLGSAPSKEREKRTGPVGGTKEVREGVGPMGKLDRLHPRLIEKYGAFEHVHRRRIEARAEVDVPPIFLSLALDHRRRGLAGESRRMQHVVVEQDSHRPGPFERGKRRLDGAAERIVEGKQTRCFAGAQDEVRQAFGAIRKRANDESLRSGHIQMYGEQELGASMASATVAR